jgi:hypothetical protein
MTAGGAMANDQGRRRAKNWALLVVLAGMALLFYFVTMLRFGGQ